MTIRLDDETFERLRAYRAAAAESPSYPYENEQERATLRVRRNARQQANV